MYTYVHMYVINGDFHQLPASALLLASIASNDTFSWQTCDQRLIESTIDPANLDLG